MIVSEQGRIAFWDNLKFFLIIAVVVGHFADCVSGPSVLARAIYLFIYIFHMPLFLFIAGMFHSDQNVTSRCLFFVALGYCQKIVFWLCYKAVGDPHDFSVVSEYDIPWYAFALAAFAFLTWLFRRRDKRMLLILGIALACFAGYDQSIGDVFILSRILVFFPVYLAGSLIGAERVTVLKKRFGTGGTVLAAVFLAALAVICYKKCGFLYHFRPLLSGRNPFTADILAFGGALARLACYAASFAAGLAFMLIIPYRNLGPVTKMGKQTLNVFIWHWPVYLVLERIFHLTELCYKGTKGMILFLLIGAAVAVALSLDRILNFPLQKLKNACFLEKKHIK